jgi:hypothetical protein
MGVGVPDDEEGEDLTPSALTSGHNKALVRIFKVRRLFRPGLPDRIWVNSRPTTLSTRLR